MNNRIINFDFFFSFHPSYDGDDDKTNDDVLRFLLTFFSIIKLVCVTINVFLSFRYGC